MTASFIMRNGERFALVRADIYERMLDDLEDLEDIRAYDHAKANPPREYFPAEMVKRLVNRENPIRVFREHRKMTGCDLAERAGITPAYLSQLEHGHRAASLAVLRRLAAALKVDIDDLIPAP